MRRSPFITRAEMVRRVEARLQSHGFPRVHMFLLVALTGAFGLMASFILLSIGLDSMAARYPLAVGVAYLFFLFLIWLWLRANARENLDVLDASGLVPSGEPPAGTERVNAGGGDFGGGGASASFDAPSNNPGCQPDTPTITVAESIGAASDADELAIPVIVVALAAGLALASFYVVYIAPALFAEVLVDGALSYVLFRRLRARDRQFWLTSALKNTLVPFAMTAVFLAVTGAVMSSYAPGATSVGQVIDYATAQETAR